MSPAAVTERGLGEEVELRAGLRLRNRLVATAHARAAVVDGIATDVDHDYWARVAAGGAANELRSCRACRVDRASTID